MQVKKQKNEDDSCEDRNAENRSLDKALRLCSGLRIVYPAEPSFAKASERLSFAVPILRPSGYGMGC